MDDDLDLGATLHASDSATSSPSTTLGPPVPLIDPVRLAQQRQTLRARMFGAEAGAGTGRAQLAHYVLLQELGHGGMGVVYEAYDQTLDRKVAIKKLHAEGGSQTSTRLLREAKAMAKLAHPNVVQIYEIGETEGAAFIVMEYVEGQTLRSWLEAQDRPWAQVLDVFRQAAKGLAAAHEKGLVHRDFKPDNVMISAYDGRVMVMDFGLAGGDFAPTMPQLAGDTNPSSLLLTQTGELMGTPAYMAPEQFARERVTPLADQFSFCVALWEGVHGQRPFAANRLAALMDAVHAGQLREPRERAVPGWLNAAMRRGLAVEAGERYPDIPALLCALEAPTRARQRLLTLAAGAVVLAALGLVGLVGLVGLAWSPARDGAPALPSADAPTLEPSQTATAPERAPSALDTPSATQRPLPPLGPQSHRQLTFRGDVHDPSLSPDGRHAAYLTDEGLLTLDLDTSRERLLLNPRNLGPPRFGADGALYVSASDEGRFELLVAGSLDAPFESRPAQRPLGCHLPQRKLRANTSYPSREVLLSPDALEGVEPPREATRRVPITGDYDWLQDLACDDRHGRVFVVRLKSDGVYSLVSIDIEQQSTTLLLESSEPISSTRYEPQSERLFLSMGEGVTRRIEIRALSAKTELGPPRRALEGIPLGPIFDIGGERLVYTRARERADLWWLPRPGRGVPSRRLNPSSAGVRGFSLDPTGERVAFTQGRDRGSALFTTTLDGAPPQLLLRSERSSLHQIAWSPDGAQIAYVDNPSGESRVWLVDVADGSTTELSATRPSSHGSRLAWAGDGELLYHLSNHRNFGLYDIPSHSERLLIRQDDVGWAFEPTPSPDGRRVALGWNRMGGERGLWTIAIDSGDERFIGRGFMRPVGWSADGRYVYASTAFEDTPKPGIWRFLAGTDEPADPDGGELWREFPPELIQGNRTTECVLMASQDLMCAIGDQDSDLWLVDGLL